MSIKLVPLKKSRTEPKAGDVFVFKHADHMNSFYFGRVIRTDAQLGGFKDVILVYLYNAKSEEKSSIPVLAKDSLMVAPLGTNAVPWKKGYFETIDNVPIISGEVLHCHYFWDPAFSKYFDADGHVVMPPAGCDPVGEYLLNSYQTIAQQIDNVLRRG